MRIGQKKIDRPFLVVTLLLVLCGFFIFSSASLGLLSREGARFSSVAFSQLVFGIGGGLSALFLFSRIGYRTYRRYAPHIFISALFVTALVFVPGIGYEAHGAKRWISFFGQSLQPAEMLKIAFVIFMAWYYSMFYKQLDDIRFSLGGLLGAVGGVAVLLFLQPDIGTFLIIATSGAAIAFASGVRLKHFLALGLFFLVCIVILALSRSYLLDRVKTFIDPQHDPRGSGYQIKQSFIAIGSGGFMGRGFGQSVQKFTYLPEPIGDSIFSVAAEEFGFIGSISIIVLFTFFAVRGLQIASHAPDRFGGLIVVGIVILIITQSFMNISSMVGLIPLTGEPLTFISHGGTSLLFALVGVGIILNISSFRTVRVKKHI